MTHKDESRMNREPQAQFYEPAEVLSYLQREVEGSLGGRTLTGIRIEGSLGRVPEGSRYAMIYGVELSGDDGSVIELAIPRRLEGVARSLEHRRVVVRGDLEPNVYRGRLNFRLEVRRICGASERGASSSDNGGWYRTG